MFLSRERSELKNVKYWIQKAFFSLFKVRTSKVLWKKIFCKPALRSLNQGVGTTVGTRWPAMRKRKPQGTF